MKKFAGIACGGLAVLGCATAVHATPTPLVSSTSADLFLFVTTSATGVTFVEDTGISINSLVPAAALQPSGSPANGLTLSGTLPASIHLSASPALQSFLALGGTVQFTVEAGQDPGGATNGICSVTGTCITIDANNAPVQNNTQLTVAGMNQWLVGLASDDNNYAQHGLSMGPNGTITIGSGAWGDTHGGGSGSTTEYGIGPDSAGIGLNVPVNVYAYTGNGSPGFAQSYSLGQVALLSDGTLESVVPLPAAIWLVGSGLLGLAGVNKRRRPPAAAPVGAA